MMRAALLTFLLLLAPGCLQAGAFSAADEYRLVLVDASYRKDARQYGVCGFDALPEIDEEARTLSFPNGERPPASARAIVLMIAWDRSQCGVADAVWATLDEPAGLARIDVPGLGIVGVEFRDDGTVRVDGQPLTPGGMSIDASGQGWNATAAFRDAGIWPADGVRAT